MSQSLATPTPANTLRAWLARVWEEPESRSTLVGIIGVILFYLLLWGVSPYLLKMEPSVTVTRPHASAKQFNIELAPDTFAKAPPPKPPPPFKFVETNPDAPENIPDKTSNFGAQNQQVAQEKPSKESNSERPATEGKKDFESTQIVSGQLVKPVEQMEAVPEQVTEPREAKVATLKAEQNPLPGFEKKEGEDKTGIGTNIAKASDNPRNIPQKIEGAKTPLIEGADATQPAIDPLKPRPRPMVVRQQQTRPAILAENNFGTANIGKIAYSAKWNEFGAYLQRMINTVQAQWEKMLIESKLYPASGSTVTVKFVMNSEGRIAQIAAVESTATEAASRACVSAITERAPYGNWTEDMKAALGELQEMTFTFYYQ